MLIDLNTDELQQIVQIARNANEALSDAANLLNSIAIHNDWQCPERTEINRNTNQYRTQSLQIQTDAESLYKNIIYAAERFQQEEQELIKSFASVDEPIARFLSQTPSSGISDKGGAANAPICGIVSFEPLADSFGESVSGKT